MRWSAIHATVFRIRPVAAQADLHEPVARHGSRFDEAAHRCPVPMELTGVGLCGVGMGIEVDETERPVAMHPCQTGPVSVGDGVVASEHDRHGPGGCDPFD